MSCTKNLALAEFVNLLRRRFDTRYDEESERVILVVGAGASIESGMPTWEDRKLRTRLVAAVGAGFGSEAAFVDEAWAQLGRHLSPSGVKPSTSRKKRMLLDQARTDDLCAVASSLVQGREALVNFLQKEYSPTREEAQPQLGYELIAHMMKHRFIDHVITLNFDEIIDAALGDELGPHGYRLVLPGSLVPDSGPKPHLFKLHGTVSSADSLRFSASDTGVLSERIADMLDGVVLGSRSSPRTWVVSLGYSWADPDLVRWLTRNRSSLAGVICVALDHVPAENLTSAVRRVEKELRRHDALAVHSIATQDIVEGASTRPATIDEILWAVWYETKRGAQDPKRVPSAARHFVSSHLFEPCGGARRWPHVYSDLTAEARFESEVFLTTGKTDGMVTLSSLARDERVQRHFGRMKSGRRTPLERIDFLRRGKFPDVTEVYVYDGTRASYADHFRTSRNRR